MNRYKISRQGQVIGEFEASAIPGLLSEGRLSFADHGWTSGMSDWKTLRELGFTAASADGRPAPAYAQHPAPPGQAALPAMLTARDWEAMPEGPMPSSCPKCVSPDIRSFGILFQQGSQVGTSVGMTFSGQVGGMVTGAQTHLAASTQPPARGGDGAGMIILFGLGLALIVYFSMDMGFFGGFFGIALGIGSLYLAFLSHSRADREHAKQMYRWKSSWCCMKCGYRFLSMHERANREG